jgi:hypothetical protein
MSTNNEDEYLAHVISLAKEAANRGESLTVPSKEEWKLETKEYEAYVEQLVRENVNQGVLVFTAPTKQEWCLKKKNTASAENVERQESIASTNLQSMAPISTIATSTDVINSSIPVDNSALQLTAQMTSSTTTNTSPSTGLGQVPSTIIISVDESTSTEQLTQHFLKLFKLFNVSTNSAKIIKPSHLTIDFIEQTQREIEEEVYRIIKDCREVADPDTKQIMIASIDFQDYQRKCSILSECQCQQKYKKPHFYFSMNPVHLSADQINSMSAVERKAAREQARALPVEQIITYNRNQVSATYLYEAFIYVSSFLFYSYLPLSLCLSVSLSLCLSVSLYLSVAIVPTPSTQWHILRRKYGQRYSNATT